MSHHDFDALHGIKPGLHFYQFYKSFEDYSVVLSAYFHAGLTKGDTCLWLISKKIGVLRMLGMAAENIPEFDRYLESGQLEVHPAEDWYLDHSQFSEERSMTNASNFVARAEARGSKAIRAAGDAGAIPQCDWNLLEIYERKISDFIREKRVLALCAYPILDCTLKETRMVIDCHDHVLIAKI